jgi:hypothetical protein
MAFLNMDSNLPRYSTRFGFSGNDENKDAASKVANELIYAFNAANALKKYYEKSGINFQF